MYLSWLRLGISLGLGTHTNKSEHIDSTTGVMLAAEFQPGPHQIFDTMDGTGVVALFATPAEARSLFYS